MRACHCSIALLLLLAAPAQAVPGAAATPSSSPSAAAPVAPRPCHVAAAAPGPDAPPAWLLLAGAVVLLGAGRLAAS